MSKDKGFENAQRYLLSVLDEEDFEKWANQNNANIENTPIPAYDFDALIDTRERNRGVSRREPAPFPAMLKPKVTPEQGRENIASFNRGIDALPSVARSYVSKTPPRQMASDARNAIRDNLNRLVSDPVGTALDMVPIVGTYRSTEQTDELNRAAKDARRKGDFEMAQKLEAASAVNTVFGIFGVLPQAAALKRAGRFLPSSEPEIPVRFLKKKPKPKPDTRTVDRALQQGFNERKANYLGMPYGGEGSHFISQKWLRKKGVPEWIINSPFNLIRGDDMSIGDFYEFHYKVDPSFHGTSLPAQATVGGGAWRGGELGLQKYGRAGRLWHGSPTPLKFAVAAPVAIGGGLYWASREED